MRAERGSPRRPHPHLNSVSLSLALLCYSLTRLDPVPRVPRAWQVRGVPSDPCVGLLPAYDSWARPDADDPSMASLRRQMLCARPHSHGTSRLQSAPPYTPDDIYRRHLQTPDPPDDTSRRYLRGSILRRAPSPLPSPAPPRPPQAPCLTRSGSSERSGGAPAPATAARRAPARFDRASLSTVLGSGGRTWRSWATCTSEGRHRPAAATPPAPSPSFDPHAHRARRRVTTTQPPSKPPPPQEGEPVYTQGELRRDQQAAYRCVLCVDGHTWASAWEWVLSTGAVRPPHATPPPHLLT